MSMEFGFQAKDYKRTLLASRLVNAVCIRDKAIKINALGFR